MEKWSQQLVRLIIILAISIVVFIWLSVFFLFVAVLEGEFHGFFETLIGATTFAFLLCGTSPSVMFCYYSCKYWNKGYVTYDIAEKRKKKEQKRIKREREESILRNKKFERDRDFVRLMESNPETWLDDSLLLDGWGRCYICQCSPRAFYGSDQKNHFSLRQRRKHAWFLANQR